MADLRIFYATNRNLIEGRSPDFGTGFNPDGVAALRFGHADFSLTGGEPKPDGAIQVYPERATKKDGFVSLGSERFLDGLKQAMKDGCSDALVFIHGYNVTFAEALEAGASLAAQIKVDDKPLNVVVFSWPSDGSAVPWMSYYSDREDARVCGPAVARAFLKLVEFLKGLDEEEYCGRSLHLLCHSMGNYVLRHGLQALIAKEPNCLVRAFTEIILAAADEDDDAFERDDKLRPLPNLGRRVTIYHNENDRALIVSDRTKANPDRLGSEGPRMLDLLPKKVIVVDCGRVAGDGDKLIQHSYFVRCPPVVSDLAETLRGRAIDAIGNRAVIRAERAYRIMTAP